MVKIKNTTDFALQHPQLKQSGGELGSAGGISQTGTPWTGHQSIAGQERTSDAEKPQIPDDTRTHYNTNWPFIFFSPVYLSVFFAPNTFLFQALKYQVS